MSEATTRSAIVLISLSLALAGASTVDALDGIQQSQSQPPPVQTPAVRPQSPSILVASDDDYRIGPRDVLEIQVEKAPELGGTFPVNSAGTFLMPYLGRTTAVQKTTEELAREIEDGLRGRYLKNPRVTVTIKQYNSRSFYIQGSVRSPGVYQIDGRASLLKLIVLAGGLAENHGSTAFIIREVKDKYTGRVSDSSPKADTDVHTSSPARSGQSSQDDAGKQEEYEMISANIAGLLKGQFDQNVMIEPGDVVNIPTTDVFFVAGEVRAPGSFPLKEGTTLRQAISLAQGTLFKADTSHGVIFREEPDGSRHGIRVDVGDVMKGKKEDIVLAANDMVIIPNSRMKSIGGTFLQAFGMSVAVRGLSW